MADHKTPIDWIRLQPWLIVISVVLGLSAAVGVAWMIDARDRETLARTLTHGNPNNGPALLRQYGCSGCHTIPALRGANGQVGPPLDNLRARVFVAGRLLNAPESLIRFISAPQETIPGCGMPDTGISATEARDVAAYLYAH